MNKLVLNSESLNNVLENKTISRQETIEIYQHAIKDPRELFSVAQNLRTKFKKETVTFSKKAFFNIINLCRDTCSYCTYKAEPNDTKLSLMNKQTVKDLAIMAKKYNCTEALFVTGEKPEQKYSEPKKWLKNEGFSSTAEYLIHCSETVLNEGVFPHTNAGNLTKNEMKELQKTNVSMGRVSEF